MTRDAKQRLAFSAVFWLAAAGMAAAYLTSPAFPVVREKFLAPWYDSLAGVVLRRPDSGLLPARHARHAILTRETLPPAAAAGNAAWFARWDQDYLAFQRREMRGLGDEAAAAAETLVVDMYQELMVNKARLTGVEAVRNEGGAVIMTVSNKTVIDLVFKTPVTPAHVRRIVLKWTPLLEEGEREGPCRTDEFCRINWFPVAMAGQFLLDEQTAIAPLGRACDKPGAVTFELAKRFDWVRYRKVNRLLIYFRLNKNLDIKIEP